MTNVDFLQGDAHALPFSDATFDITHAHQVLTHIGDPVRALREMKRVTKPGGIVACRESDNATFIWFPESEIMTEWGKLHERVRRANGGEPNAGRRLKMWAREAGFDPAKVVCSAGTWCYHTAEERAWWGGLWADRIVQPEFANAAVKEGVAETDVQRMSQAWREWAASEDGWFAILHGEIICRVEST